MKKLKFLNVCYDTKHIDNKFSEYFSSYINNFFTYEHKDELIELINTKDIHFVVTRYDFELLKTIRRLNKQIQIIAILDEYNHRKFRT
jgi:two-component system, OmpR family, response regulator VanR